MGTYGHVIDEFEERPRLAAEEAIAEARKEIAGQADKAPATEKAGT